MKIEQLKKAKELLADLDLLKDIKAATQEEHNHWWAFVSPDTKRRSDGIIFPKSLRYEFEKIVESEIQKIIQEIEKL